MHDWDAVETAERIRRGEVSRREVIERAIERAKAASHLNAVVTESFERARTARWPSTYSCRGRAPAGSPRTLATQSAPAQVKPRTSRPPESTTGPVSPSAARQITGAWGEPESPLSSARV